MASPGQGKGDPEYDQCRKHQEHHEAGKKRAASCLADEPFTAEAHECRDSSVLAASRRARLTQSHTFAQKDIWRRHTRVTTVAA